MLKSNLISIFITYFTFTLVFHLAYGQNIGFGPGLLDNKSNFENKKMMTIESFMATANNTISQEDRKNRNQTSNGNFESQPGDSFVLNTGRNFSALNTYWNNSAGFCGNTFKCTVNTTTGWKDGTSIQFSTTNTNDSAWSWIRGKEIHVRPNATLGVITHLDLNKYARGSHIVIEGFNETSKNWYQLLFCPPGTNGPLEWKEFNCKVKIPEDTSRVNTILNAGWSSQRGEEATTLFDAINIKLTKP
jgi:hypothetical protein